jgi:serine O-acetyltransferase
MSARIASKEDYRRFLESDLVANKLSRWKWWFRFRYPILNWQRLLRHTEYLLSCKRGVIWRIYRLMTHYRVRQGGIKLGFTIHPNNFGSGLAIVQRGTIVVNPAVRVGQNCRLHPGTCLGETETGAPVLGDNVYIGPGAKLFGGIVLGNNVQIVANAVVNRSFPDGNTTLVGVPARSITTRARESAVTCGCGQPSSCD